MTWRPEANGKPRCPPTSSVVITRHRPSSGLRGPGLPAPGSCVEADRDANACRNLANCPRFRGQLRHQSNRSHCPFQIPASMPHRQTTLSWAFACIWVSITDRTSRAAMPHEWSLFPPNLTIAEAQPDHASTSQLPYPPSGRSQCEFLRGGLCARAPGDSPRPLGDLHTGSPGDRFTIALFPSHPCWLQVGRMMAPGYRSMRRTGASRRTLVPECYGREVVPKCSGSGVSDDWGGDLEPE